MANRHRGETPFKFESRVIMLKVTLASLAELEDALGAGDLAALGERLATGRMSARDIAAVLAAGFLGAGKRIEPVDLAQRIPASDLDRAAEAAVQLLASAFGVEEAARPPSPQAVGARSHRPRSPFRGMRRCASGSAACGSPPTTSGR